MGEAHGAQRRNAGTLHGAGIIEWDGRTAHGAVMQGRYTAPGLKNVWAGLARALWRLYLLEG